MAPGRVAWFKTARYLATCYFCYETIERAASAAGKNRMFLPHAPLPRAIFYISFSFSEFSMLETILIEGLIYGIMVLGLFISYRTLNFCDMTVDGAFPMGGCILAA